MSNIYSKHTSNRAKAHAMFRAGSTTDDVCAAMPSIKRATVHVYRWEIRSELGLVNPSAWQLAQRTAQDPLMQ